MDHANDEALRNKIVVPAPTRAWLPPPSRVVEIDFERSGVVVAQGDDGGQKGEEDKRPENPIDREWDDTLSGDDLDEWMPSWYRLNLSRRRCWLVQEFGGEKAAKYRPVKSDIGSLGLQYLDKMT